MLDQLLFVLTFVAALGSGLIAGVFFAFSTFVMQALARRPSHEGIAAMQSINVVVLNRWFLSVFLGTAAICILVPILVLLRWPAPGAAFQLAGSVLYLIGTLLVTIACNVPRNDALARLAPSDLAASAIWTRYVSEWTAWNHVRTAAALAAAAAFTFALAAS
jgi:uncharacterized membrane protein